MEAKTARLLFTIGALFNFGAVLLFMPALGIAERLGIGPAPTGTIFEDIGIAAIFVFGVGYWLAAQALEEYRGFIKVGILSKFVIVALVVAHYLAGNASLLLTLAISGDLIFAALFISYLRSTSPAAQLD